MGTRSLYHGLVLIVTVYIATSLNIQSQVYTDNRESPYNPPLSGPL